MRTLLGIGILLAAVGLARADEQNLTVTTPPHEATVALSKLHASNHAEIAAAELAQQRAAAPAVKRYADRLCKDHAAADEKVVALAKRKQLTLSTPASAELDELRNLSGDAFDRAFLTMMVQDHEASIDSAKSALGTVQDKDVRLLLARTLPVLRSHRDEAQRLQGSGKS